jgi:hypothetical protein
MAQRRMFSKHIVTSEEFLEMPEGSQLLYFHLGMSADDDGCVQQAQIMRLTGAKPDALKVLEAKGFVIPLEGGRVMVITHWKINNWIQKDRYQPSMHRSLITESGIIQDDRQIYTKCIHLVSIGKDRIGKDRIGKVTIADENTSAHSEIVKKYYDLCKAKGIEKPIFNGGKDGSIVKRILNNYGREKTMTMLSDYFSKNEGEYCGYTIGGFLSSINKLQLKPAAAASDDEFSQYAEDVKKRKGGI